MEVIKVNDFKSFKDLSDYILDYIEFLDRNNYPISNRAMPLKRKYKSLLQQTINDNNEIYGIKIYFHG